jgi:hypothetical protein
MDAGFVKGMSSLGLIWRFTKLLVHVAIKS